MEDQDILNLYFARDEAAITATSDKYREGLFFVVFTSQLTDGKTGDVTVTVSEGG